MEEKKLSRSDMLMIVISVLLALILLAGTGFGFYYLGSKKNDSGKTVTQSSTTPTSTSDSTNASGTSTGTVADNSLEGQQLLDSLKGAGGSFDASKVESQLSNILGQQGGSYSTDIPLVAVSEVATTSNSGKDAIKTYLDAVNAKIQNSQTSTLSDSAMMNIFSGDTSSLDVEIAKNQKIYNDLKAITTPSEAVSIQQKYLSLFLASVNVMNAEKAMILGNNVDTSALAQAQGLINLSKQIDSDVTALKEKYGL
jgi:hypothetical protein